MDIVTFYHDALDRLVALAGVPRAVLQVHAGMAIYLGCLLLMGTRRGSLAAVILVVTLAIGHEGMNRLEFGSWNWRDTTRDLLLAMFWPTMCYAVSSYRRWVFAETARQRAGERLLHLYDYRPLSASRAPSAKRAGTASRAERS